MLLAEVGAGALLAGLALSGFGAMLGFWSGARGDVALVKVARRALHLATAAVILACAALMAAFLSHDFLITFVATHSNLATPVPLLAAGFYGGQEGSLLYWTLVVAVIGSLSIAGTAVHRVSAYATGLLATILSFFLLVLNLVANPFATLGWVPADGTGLNPILRDGGMLIHPPFLLAGFASFAIPFSFAMASLLAGRSDAAWIAYTRRLALLAWGLQSAGLTLGMWWAYHVLGWGGYWGWDAVENVALLPWLVTTAYIHSSQVQERRGLLKAWNFGLVIAAFLLAIFGTFVVRSGIIQSVHSFAISAIGPWFLGFLAIAVVGSGVLLALRAPLLRGDHELESSYSREGAFLLQNLLFLGLTAVVLWGTVLPLVSQLLVGRSAVVGPAFYERATGPLFLLLMALLAVGPLLPWRRAGSVWVGTLRWPATAALAVLAALVTGGVRDIAPLLAGPVLAAAATTSILEWIRGARFARRLPGPWLFALTRLVGRNRRRYGAYLAHLGIVIAAVGFAGSHFWQQERQLVLHKGQPVAVGQHVLTLTGQHTSRTADSASQGAEIALGDGTVMRPGRVVYESFGGQSSTQVAIRSSVLEDLYLVLTPATGTADGVINLTVFINPLVSWIWAGAALLIIGTIAGSWPGGRRSPAPAGAPARARVLAGTAE
ncbi:MAG: cytochrome c biogenesis protein CcsA [Candidatus Dormibacteraeota bacterium]|nr:cytochrome c biogenesis protein CcsA [Candidatus Dormibacteraeota bacterium]